MPTGSYPEAGNASPPSSPQSVAEEDVEDYTRLSPTINAVTTADDNAELSSLQRTFADLMLVERGLPDTLSGPSSGTWLIGAESGRQVIKPEDIPLPPSPTTSSSENTPVWLSSSENTPAWLSPTASDDESDSNAGTWAFSSGIPPSSNFSAPRLPLVGGLGLRATRRTQGLADDRWSTYLSKGIKFSVLPDLTKQAVFSGNLIRCRINLDPQLAVSNYKKMEAIFSGVSTVEGEPSEAHTFFQHVTSIIPKDDNVAMEGMPYREWSFHFVVPHHLNCACSEARVPIPPTYPGRVDIKYSIRLKGQRKEQFAIHDQISVPVEVRQGYQNRTILPRLVENVEIDGVWKFVRSGDQSTSLSFLTLAEGQITPITVAEIAYHVIKRNSFLRTRNIFVNYYFSLQHSGRSSFPNDTLSSLMERLQISLSPRILLKKARGNGDRTLPLPLAYTMPLKVKKVGVRILDRGVNTTWRFEGWIQMSEDEHMTWNSCHAELQVVLSAKLSHPALSSDIRIEIPFDQSSAIEVDIDDLSLTPLPHDRSSYTSLVTSTGNAPSTSPTQRAPNTFPVDHMYDGTTAQALPAVLRGNSLAASTKIDHPLVLRHISSFQSYQCCHLSSGTCFELSDDVLHELFGNRLLPSQVASIPNFSSTSMQPASVPKAAEILEPATFYNNPRVRNGGVADHIARESLIRQYVRPPQHNPLSKTSSGFWSPSIPTVLTRGHQAFYPRYAFPENTSVEPVIPNFSSDSSASKGRDHSSSTIPMPVSSNTTVTNLLAMPYATTVQPVVAPPCPSSSDSSSTKNETAALPLRLIKVSPRGRILYIYPMENDLICFWDHQKLRVESRLPTFPSEQFRDMKTNRMRNKWTELKFDKETYVEVRLGKDIVNPWTGNGQEWFKGQLLYFGNCQNPSFKFFSEQFTTDDPANPPVLHGEPFSRKHLVSGKCRAHAGQESLIQLCRFQLEATSGKADLQDRQAARQDKEKAPETGDLEPLASTSL
ncbi:hypothetical protein BT69DRAFT_1345375 [Atractiella rhizophila]|nr:hypothetical protein BT69DRAFT_1345375 [Atractiella rhizophila]